MKIVMLGPFGMHPKATMLARALPAARALAARGHEVVLVMPPWHTPEKAARRWDDEVPGTSLEYVDLRGLGVPVFGHLLVAARMVRRARVLGADVVHVFKPKAYSGLAGGMLRWLRAVHLEGRVRPALVVDTDDWEGPGGWNDLEPYSAAQRKVFAWQERSGLARHADVVTVASRALETLILALGVPSERVVYLPNALDDSPAGPEWGTLPPADAPVRETSPDEVYRDDTAPDDNARVAAASEEIAASGAALDRSAKRSPAVPRARPFTLLLYTRFFEFDLERPLDVLARLRDQVPDTRLLVVGKGLFGEEKRFRALAERMGLGDAMEDRGWVDEAGLVQAMRDSDVAIYPFDDTLINRSKSSAKLLRLLSAGMPVVAEAVGQNAELIEHAKSGILVPSDAPEAFAKALCSLAEDTDRLARLGEGARRRIQEQFRWSNRADDLETAYRQAIELRKGAENDAAGSGG